MPGKLQAVLFDLDGTLVRTFIDFPAMRDDVRRRAQESYRATDAILKNTDSLDIIALTVGALPAEQRGHAVRDLYSILEKHEHVGCEHPEAIPGATKLLQELRDNGVRIAIATRNARSIAISLCRRMGLLADAIVAREDTETYKPHPDPLLLACAHLEVRPEYTAMVGDLWADIAAGTAAGCSITIGIQWSHDPPDRFLQSRPTHIVTTLTEAHDIILPLTR